MNSPFPWSRILKIAGAIAMVLGSIDPLEGSVLIVPGSGLIALAMYLGGNDRQTILYWMWSFILIAIGVAAMFSLSAVGGIGGRGGHSWWWGAILLPYPVGWLMALAGGIIGLMRFFKGRRPARA